MGWSEVQFYRFGWIATLVSGRGRIEILAGRLTALLRIRWRGGRIETSDGSLELGDLV